MTALRLRLRRADRRRARAARRQGHRSRRDDPARRPRARRLHDHDRRLPRVHGRRGRCLTGWTTRSPSTSPRLEERAGKRFGDPDDPLLVSVRSGAAVSMPGMMDTILNLGLNDAATEGLARTTGNPRFAYDSYRRLIQMYGEVVDGIDPHRFEQALARPEDREAACARHRPDGDDLRGLVATVQGDLRRGRSAAPFPEDARDQLARAVRAVFDSWDTPRAQVYRRAQRRSRTISAPPSTSCRWSSATRATARRPASASPATRRPARAGCTASSSLNAQGEDVVAGHPHARAASPRWSRACPWRTSELLDTMRRLEEHYRDMQDIEFTVEDEQALPAADADGEAHGGRSAEVRRLDGRGGTDLARGGRRRGSTRPSSTSCCTR